MYFLDTTFLVGLFVSNDQWHPQAIEVYKKIKNGRLIISKLVIAEMVTVLKNKIPTKDIREIYNNIPHLFEIMNISEIASFDSDFDRVNGIVRLH